MARGHLWERLVSNVTGLPLANAVVTVRLVGTETATGVTLYDSLGGSGTVNNPLTTGTDGVVDFYVDVPDDFDLAVEAAGYTVPGFPITIASVKAHHAQADLVSKTGTQTLTNKTLTAPILTSPEIDSPTVTGQMLLPGGSAGTPAIAKTGDPDTGPSWPAADTYAINVGGTEGLRVVAGSKFPQVVLSDYGDPYSDDIRLHVQPLLTTGDGDVVMINFETDFVQNTGGAGAGGLPDSAILRTVAYQLSATADGAVRSIEAHVFRQSGAGASANARMMVMNADVHSTQAGNGTDKIGSIAIGSYSTAPLTGTPQPADYGIWGWGTEGFTWFIRHTDTTGNQVWAVTGAGSQVIAGDFLMTGTNKKFQTSATSGIYANTDKVIEWEPDGAGGKIAFFAGTRVAKQAAFTQTYATADRTISNLAASALNVSVGTFDGTVQDVGGAFSQTTLNNNFRDLADTLNSLIIDHTDTKQALNAVVDTLQAYNLA